MVFLLPQLNHRDWYVVLQSGYLSLIHILEATQELVAAHPGWEKAIRDYYGRWTEMLKSPIYDTVEIFRLLKDSNKYKLYALTNWQAGLFDIALVPVSYTHLYYHAWWFWYNG